MKKIGFVGIGVMGSSMVKNLLKAGYEVSIYTRTKSKADECIKSGAVYCTSIKEIAQQVDFFISMVGYPKDVFEVYLSEGGCINYLKEGSIAIDMTTSSPELARKIYEKGKEKKIGVLDAPVSGGDIGAKNATLTIMVGGEEEHFNKSKEILSVMGKNIILQGSAGAGQNTKMANQIAIASNMIGVTEAIFYAMKNNLNPELVLESISGGAAGSWSLSNLIPRVLKEDYSPGFFIKHFIKDMEIAISVAEEENLKLPGLTLAHSMYKKLSEMGFDEEGTQALIKLYYSSLN